MTSNEFHEMCLRRTDVAARKQKANYTRFTRLKVTQASISSDVTLYTYTHRLLLEQFSETKFCDFTYVGFVFLKG